ncbi:MAG: transposase [Gammaproteobacteria bacterium]
MSKGTCAWPVYQGFSYLRSPSTSSSGATRQACFYAEEDHRFYLECLGEAAEKYRASVHAYVLMTNHVHLLMTAQLGGRTSRVMQTLGRRYVRYVNHTYRRSGTLWEGRYHASLVQSDRYLLTCYRYIELNPARANIAEGPDDYRLSSYPCNALGQRDHLIEPHEDYLRLMAEPALRQAVYRDLFRVHIDPELLKASGKPPRRTACWHRLFPETD